MKLFSKKSTARQVNRTEALACVPVILPSVSWQKTDSGEILIEYPLMVKPFLQAIFHRFNKGQQQEIKRKLQLDGLGSQVWLYIDGKKRVRDIIDEFAEASTITRHEAELSVTAFLRELGKRGLIMLR